MTLFPIIKRVVRDTVVALQSVEDSDGRVQGPLKVISDYLKLDFLDDEWKRALFLGGFLTIASFFIALIGNLTFSDPAHSTQEDEEDASADETEKVEKVEAREAPLREDQQILEETKDNLQFEDVPSDAQFKTVTDAAALERENSELNKTIMTEAEEVLENAKEATIEKWNFLTSRSKAADGGSSQFTDLIEKLRPRWLTPEVSANIRIVSHLYSRLFDHWINSHKFNSPISLNAMLGGLFFRDFKNEIRDIGTIDNATLSLAHYYLGFANASYSSDLLNAGILLRSVKRASLGSRDEKDRSLRHVLFIDHLTKSVILMLRGTSDFEDMIVDLLAEEVEFMEGVAHKGLLEEARSILAGLGSLIEETLDETGYTTLVLTGHSLGAGAAVLASILIRNEYPSLNDIDLKCFVFGCPPVIGPPEAFPPTHSVFSKIEIVSFVNNADVICRTSLFGLELGVRLWIALDSIQSFSFTAKMQALMKGKLPDDVVKEAMRLLHESESKSRYKKMVTPGKCVWFIKQDDKIVVSCPSEPTKISTQPMFVGNSWLLDHSLVKYRAVMESV